MKVVPKDIEIIGIVHPKKSHKPFLHLLNFLMNLRRFCPSIESQNSESSKLKSVHHISFFMDLFYNLFMDILKLQSTDRNP